MMEQLTCIADALGNTKKKTKRLWWLKVPTEGCLACAHTNQTPAAAPPALTSVTSCGCSRRCKAYFAFHKAVVEKQTPTSLNSQNTRRGRGVRAEGAPHLSNPSWPRRWVGITVKRPINETPIVRGAERAQQRDQPLAGIHH